ncbi:LAME_0G17832g1_1 [Lachancea meyersii CBS 8951]|uniref:LAME_0G17832g1_1 n=1 Tax=Lachancea meyersii CBS 8951 TaxID=1266667 RepID=A0A1G4KBN4_9SACH|nr:LAME_0G17832g1_1 [Lachancea meyersii CBS 8951]
MESKEELKVYQESLEREIENKEYFLKQARNALEALQKNGSEKTLNDDPDLWNSFLEKPMFFPDRSDPAGLSLASYELRQRLESSQQYLQEEPLEPLEEMLGVQKTLNDGLQELEYLLSQRLKGSKTCNFQRTYQSSLSRNSELWAILKLLLENFVAVDLSPKGLDTDLVAENMFKLMERLVKKREKVAAKDFEGQCSGLYRILLRANFIRKTDDDCFAELEDFSEIF